MYIYLDSTPVANKKTLHIGKLNVPFLFVLISIINLIYKLNMQSPKSEKRLHSKKTMNNSKREDISNNTLNTSLEQESMKLVPMRRTDFNLNIIENWIEIRAKNQPRRRSFHTSFIHDGNFYIVAGIDISSGKLNDIKKIGINDQVPTWENVYTIGVTLGMLIFIL